MSDMSSIQNGPISCLRCLGLKLGSFIEGFPLEMSQAVYDGQQQQDIHILHTKTDEEEGCVDVTQCIYVYSYIFREKGNKYVIQGS